MKSRPIICWMVILLTVFVWSGCSQSKSQSSKSKQTVTVAAAENSYGGFKSQIAWGRHLVTLGGCNDCHTPKEMTPTGPVPNMALMLSGHPANAPVPDVNRKEIEGKGLIATNDLTVWVGPWGISYAANLTPDETGIGNWTQAQFIKAIREQKFKGMDGTRPLLPPMSFVAAEVSHGASDAELAAIFAYLKSIKPVQNVVPQPEPPAMASRH